MSYAFEMPVVLKVPDETLLRTVDDAAVFVRRRLQERFSLAGLNALLLLERVVESDEVEEARRRLCSWASSEQLLRSARN
jgi:hypothetical protein